MQKLLQRGQEMDQFVVDLRQKEESEHVLELRHTIQIMQEKMVDREGEALDIKTSSSQEYLSVRVHLGPIFVSILFSLKLSCPGGTLGIIWRMFCIPRRQSSS